MFKLGANKKQSQQAPDNAQNASGVSDSDGKTNQDARKKSKGLLPYILGGIAVGICLLIIGTAGLVAYDRATNPIWHPEWSEEESSSEEDVQAEEESAEESEQQAESEQKEAADETAAEQQSSQPAASEPVAQHDFECDYFYVDVSDAWKDNFVVEETEPNKSYTFSIQLDGGLLPTTMVEVDYTGGTLSGHQEELGPTSDGHTIQLAHAATPFISGKITDSGGATITLK